MIEVWVVVDGGRCLGAYSSPELANKWANLLHGNVSGPFIVEGYNA